jgi:hypothetical protein
LKRKTPIRFRLYPERKTLYFEVRIWEDQEAMKGGINRWVQKRTKTVNMLGLCVADHFYRKSKDGTKRLSAQCGTIDLRRDQLHSDTVAHEIAHAAVQWARRMKIQPMDHPGAGFEPKDNERFADAIGNMIGQFSNRAHKMGLW